MKIRHQMVGFHGIILSASHSAYDQERLSSACHRVGQGSIRRIVRQVLLAGKETDEWSSLFRHVIANRAAQHRIAGFKRVEDRALRHRSRDFKCHLSMDPRERS
jgi:hypothetical protein